jgi:alkylation response protein AidB-like acyl-CoA dehydrogenase
MVIKGSDTATLNFGENDSRVGEILGNEWEGMKIMFQIMNEARLGTGIQGLALSSAAYEHAVAYVRQRARGPAIR